jgi:hypothetical protein
MEKGEEVRRGEKQKERREERRERGKEREREKKEKRKSHIIKKCDMARCINQMYENEVCNNGHNIPHRTVKNASLNVTTNLSA